MSRGGWILYGDEPHRIVECAKSKVGIHKTMKVHFLLDNGVENIVQGRTEVRLIYRTKIKQRGNAMEETKEEQPPQFGDAAVKAAARRIHAGRPHDGDLLLIARARRNRDLDRDRDRDRDNTDKGKEIQ